MIMSERIYLDNAATTPMDSRVVAAMDPYLNGVFGNPSSLHCEGREARAAVTKARSQVAGLLNAQSEEIVFTASGTEADNLGILGVMNAPGNRRNHLITTAIEHPAVLETCRYLETRGFDVSYLPVDGDGLVDPHDLVKALRPTTQLVSVMSANNVVGTLQPVTELGRIAREFGLLFHTDAVQAVGRVPFDLANQPIDLLSMSAHKIYGPKGVGALFVRKGVEIRPELHGGGQERGLRSATENVAGIVGFGQAAEIARADMASEAARQVHLRDRLIDGVRELLPNAYLIGHRYRRLPGHVCIGFAGQEGEAIKLLMTLDQEGIAISTGSACSAHRAGEPSHVLQAMGYDAFRARGSLRITLGRFNQSSDVERFLEVLPRVAAQLRPITTRSQEAA